MNALRRTLLVVATSAAALVATTGTSAASSTAPHRSVLVIAAPGLTWEDLAEHDLPNLHALVDESAVANLSLRVERLATQPGDGYATLGAGTRSYGRAAIAGDALEPDEAVGAVGAAGAAAAEFERRTGRPLNGAIGVLAVDEIANDNDEGLFEGEPGRLGDALALAGIDRGVVANADIQPWGSDTTERHREAALALMTSDGLVGCGTVGDALLTDDPAGPFGRRYVVEAAVAAYSACRRDRSVVLVEASELRRAILYEPFVARDHRDARWAAALAATDRLVGELLERAGPDDAVVLVAPAAPASTPRLTVLAVRARRYPPGLLVSATTRQPGYVMLADVTPTIAQLAGAAIDTDELEGRPVTRARRGGSSADRLEFLVDGDAAARFRDRMQPAIAATFITLSSLFAVLVALRFLQPSWRFLPRRVLEWFAIAIIMVPPLTYLAALFPMHEWGATMYSIVVFGGAAVSGALISFLHRRWLLPVIIPFALLLAVVAWSVVALDSRLQLSTVFGDSPIIAGRFSGINNVTFAQICAAAIVLGAMLVHGLSRRPAILALVTLFGAVAVVDVAPMWGADVGGILAGIPAFAIAAALLAGWRIRGRTIVFALLATAGVLAVLGMVDLARDPSDRTHLGRLFERIGADGLPGLTTVVQRKLAQNLRTLTGSIWRFILVPVFVSAVVVAWTRPRPFRALRTRFAPLETMLAGLGVAGLLGYLLNDSGVAIPGIMLALVTPAVGYLLLRTES